MNDNLELGCTFIEKAATDKAIREIDERLLPAYQVRHRYWMSSCTLSAHISYLSKGVIAQPLSSEPQQPNIGKSAQARAKAKAAGQPFFDAAVLSGSARFPRALPESLQPRAGHLSPAQVRVYEDFARIPRTAAGFGAQTIFPQSVHSAQGYLLTHSPHLLTLCVLPLVCLAERGCGL